MNKIALLLILTLTLISTLSFAQEISNEEVSSSPFDIKFEKIKDNRLKRIWRDLVNSKYEMNRLKKTLKSDLDMVSRIQNESKLSKLEIEYEKNQFSFIEAITNIDLEKVSSRPKTTFTEDIKQILDPVLNTFKKISERPREIQQLNDELDVVTFRFANATKALAALEEFNSRDENKEFKSKLRESIKDTKELVKELGEKKEDLQYTIISLNKAEQSIVTTFSALIFEFIKTKGKNLVLALLVFIFVYWLFKTGQGRFINLMMFRMHKSKNFEVYQWALRPLRVVYSAVTTMVAFFLSLLTLYVLNDWVLVTVILIILAALVWSSKQYLPEFFEQSKIILNLGMVREGERVQLYGLPWEIKSLGYYCRLSNPSLLGGDIKVSTKELLVAHSRKVNKGESWFPTQAGDWLDFDGKMARVIQQTPEHVTVRLIGGEHVQYQTIDFLALSFKNISKGFGVEFNFGIDYSHQSTLFSEVIPHFKNEVRDLLIEDIPELKHNIHEFNIDFHMANASSLDIRFFIKCSGDIAHLKNKIERKVQSEFVKLCNKHHYTIPFNQLTVHIPKQ